MLARVAVAAVALYLSSLALADTASAPTITGRYHSNWDEVRLVQQGDRVTGTYVCCGGGTIEGRIVEARRSGRAGPKASHEIEGRTIRYRWRQPGASGEGIWTIRGGRLEGTWGVGQSATDGGRWDLERARPAQHIAN
jgi:hypothetical protein